MEWTWSFLLGLVAAASIFVLQALTKNTHKTKLPPGPTGLPIIGILHKLGKLPHIDFHQLSKKYGSIMYVKLGLIPTVVVSSAKSAELFLKTNDLVFASRPPNQASKHILYDQKNLTFSPYGSYWRGIRKMCSLELLSPQKIASFMPMRKQEVDIFIKSIKEAAEARSAVDLSSKITTLATDMTCRMVCGKKYSDEDLGERGFGDMVHEGMHLAGTLNLGDYIPPIACLDLQGITKRMKAISVILDDFAERVIDEHIQNKGKNGNTDFVDVMLNLMESEEKEYNIDRENIKALFLDMLVAAMDTSSTTMEWTISEIIKHPVVLKKVQNELEKVVGMERMVEESDLDSLEYLEMVVKESLRLLPVGPLLIPHESTEDCVIDGFNIPKKTRLMVNAWSIGRDPNAWSDADKFWPERFIGNDVDIRGHDFNLIPFGSGRRGCPGLQLGLIKVRLVIGQLLHCFDWELLDNMDPTDLDMTEEFGLVTRRANPLRAIPIYRLNV